MSLKTKNVLGSWPEGENWTQRWRELFPVKISQELDSRYELFQCELFLGTGRKDGVSCFPPKVMLGAGRKDA